MDIFSYFKGIYALAYKSFGFQAMYLFLRISHLQIPWTTTSFKDFAGVVFFILIWGQIGLNLLCKYLSSYNEDNFTKILFLGLARVDITLQLLDLEGCVTNT